MNTRTFFILALGILSFLLFMEWQRDYAAPPRPSTDTASDSSPSEPEPSTESVADLPDLPTLQDAPDSEAATPPPAEIRASRRIEVVTDVLKVDIDANGGTLVDLRLKDYPVAVDQPDEPFVLLVEQLPELFVAQAGLLADGMPAPNHTSRWEFERDYYEIPEGSDRLEVPLSWRDESGLEVVATWIFYRGDYVVDLEFEVRNGSGQEWRGARYVQLQRTEPDFSDAGPAFTNPERFSYNGGAWFSPGDGMRKLPFEDIESRSHSDTFEGGWAAFIQHYFLAAWIPPKDQTHRYSTRYVSADRLPRHVIAATSPQVTVADGDSHSFAARLYAGPKLQNRLDEIADGLVLSVDYRWFRILSQPLFWALDKIHIVIGHWGWSIVVLTLLIKLIFYKLTEAQFRSMGKMRKLQPRIQQLKERYGDDRQKFGQAMMDIYKKEKVNPLGGCLPILVQIPIFISLYWVLLESVELRQTSFLWVPDLSRPDPYFILPILNGAFMIITQRLMPTAGMDPTQRKIMMWLPVVFAFMFALFPAGLVLYWATNAGVSLAQQWYILKRLEREG
ncbi:membrane protein insertase YidC [Wenzhouxiangella limi]|uniref:Membrane protein insertase YidC n=1 Tax=Wenzhouxiangella limi TaxID=2707351 RepID=A0A845UXD6_9GAMM|nr:membrane protein insertase YidC [Wenzhouxiangella limi]NDY95164.1 membrane protein insertase YidC [Wenzhouxiangella limi]